MQRLVERVQDEAGMRAPTGSPADDPASVGVDDENDVDEPRPRRDIGEVRYPQHVRRRRTELPVDPVERAWCCLVADGGAHRLAADHASQAIACIRRVTVQRATSNPSRRRCRQTLRTP